ncbi:hypothetical protein [Sinorhizobium fredii]|uniref:hypothetical protein n=1 Tax=Rhizobium fredii TaxID=380 RepID=UPI0004AF8F3D|nr:hypothetical protein [Sinorhizobium fredii]
MANENLALNEVYSIEATSEADTFVLSVNLTDIHGDTYDCEYVSRPDDGFGLNPAIRQWLTDNPEFPIVPYAAPTDEEIRASMPSLTARQLRLGLVSGGFIPAQVSAVIEGMQEGAEKEAARIEWEYATTFNRMHPLIASVGGALGLTDEQIDVLWTAALGL